MEKVLTEVETRYLDHHRALEHSDATINHYKDSFRLLHKWIEATSREPDPGSLTTSGMEQFSCSLQVTPTRVSRGSTQRSNYGILGVMKDLKAGQAFYQEEADQIGIRLGDPMLDAQWAAMLKAGHIPPGTAYHHSGDGSEPTPEELEKRVRQIRMKRRGK